MCPELLNVVALLPSLLMFILQYFMSLECMASVVIISMLMMWTVYKLELLQISLLANTGNVQHKHQSQKPQESRPSTTRQAPFKPTPRKQHPATARPTHVPPQPTQVRPVQGHGSLPNTPQGQALLPSPSVRLPTHTHQGVLPSPSVRPALSTSIPHGQVHVPLPSRSVRASVPTYCSQPSPHPFPYPAVPPQLPYSYPLGMMLPPPNYPAPHQAGPPASPNYPPSSAALVLTQPARVPLSQPSSQPPFLHSNSYPSNQRFVVPSSSVQHASVFPHTASRSPPYRQTISSQHQPKETNTLPNPMGERSAPPHPTGLQQPYYVGNNMMSYVHHHPGQLPHNTQVIVPGPVNQSHPRGGMQNRQKHLSRNTNRQHKGKTS